MGKSASTRVLLNKYYEAVARKGNWQSLLSENFLLTGSVAKETRGRDAYVNLGFWKLVKSLRVKEMIVEGDNAFALISYDLVSPKGSPFSSDVAEFWKVKDGSLDSIAIYFDTAAFNKSMSQ
jgi:ketosteroid isomerase-like protein